MMENSLPRHCDAKWQTGTHGGPYTMRGRVLLVDLNNFARYPSIAIGYLTAILRAGGYDVELLAPLATGVGGVPREPRSPWWGRFDLEFRYRTAVSRNRMLRADTSAICRLPCIQARAIEACASCGVRKRAWTTDSTPYWFQLTSCITRIALRIRRDLQAIAAYPCCWAVHISRRTKLRREWIDIPGSVGASWVARSNLTCANSCVAIISREADGRPARRMVT